MTGGPAGDGACGSVSPISKGGCIMEISEAYEAGSELTQHLEVNGRKFYYNPRDITIDEEVLSIVKSVNGPESAYVMYRDESVGVVIY
ncbi:hypothetical protein ABNC55_17865 [Paenibacillus larvae]